MRRLHKRNNRSGFTLIEVIMTTLLLGLVGSAIALFSRTTTGALDVATVGQDVETAGRRALERVKELMFDVAFATVDPRNESPFFSTTIEFQRVIGETGGVPDLGPLERLLIEPALGELNDGLDNNNNGLVDELQLVWVLSAGLANEQRVVLCKRIGELYRGEAGNGLDDNGNEFRDEPGCFFFFDEATSRIDFRLFVEASAAEGDMRLGQTYEATIASRN